MESSNDEKTLVRRYLLGETTEPETEGIEEKMIIDDNFFEKIISEKEELIEQYAQGDMPEELKAKFERSFLSTPEGRDQVLVTKELLKFAPILKGRLQKAATRQGSRSHADSNIRKFPAWSNTLANPYLKNAALILIFFGITFGIYRAFFHKSDAEKGMEELKRVHKDRRPTEARLTEFDYAPWSVLRSEDNNQGPGRLSSTYAERILLDAIHNNPSAESYHALGVFYMTERRFDEALAQFEVSANYASPSARLHSDWGAVLLEKGKEDRSNGDLDKSTEGFNGSLRHLNKAIELDSTILEALFNRALLFKEMKLPAQAEDELRNYLEKDIDSKWADEARQMLKLLEEERSKSSQNKQQALQDFLSSDETKDDEKAWKAIKNGSDVTGNTIVNRLLDEFLDLAAKGKDSEAQIRLQMLSYVGELELRNTKDHFTSDLAQFYRQASPGERASIARARKSLRSGHDVLLQGDPRAATTHYTRARRIFEQCRDLLELAITDYWLSFCLVPQHLEKQALPILNRLDLYCKSKSYQWLRVRCLYALSGAHSNLSAQSKAIHYAKQALSLAQQLRDEDGALKTTIPLIDYYRGLGNYNQCLFYAGLSLNFNSLEPIQSWRHYWFLASSLYYFGLYEAAIEYEKESLRRAERTGIKHLISLCYVSLGMIYGKIGRLDDALENTRLAIEILKLHPDEKMRQNGMAYSYLQRGHIYRHSKAYDDATSSYDKSIELYDRLEFRTHLYQAHKGKLFCYIEEGKDSLAKKEIQTTLGLLEKYRSKITEDDDRSTFFDVEQSTYDLAIGFEYSRMANPIKAFEYSEESRSRSLLNLMDRGMQALDQKNNLGSSPRPIFSALKLQQIMGSVPEEVGILQYTLLENNLLIWVITNSLFESVSVDITQKSLNEKVLGYLQVISNIPDAANSATPALARELYDILIKPVEPFLKGSKQICIVPDKVLNHLPFNALVSSTSNKYMIEEYLLTAAPSSSIFVACTEIARRKAGFRNERLLAVGNPRFDRAKFPKLPNLPSAEREAEHIRSYYEVSFPLTGGDATKDHLMSEMEKADVIHLALHSIVDERNPLFSKLILAKESSSAGDEESDGALQTYELYGLKFLRARLAVLSACQTGAERYYRGEGMVSIARPFIAIGVPLIVASLWPIESESTARLMVDFHKYRKQGVDTTAESLRRAQLKMLADATGSFSHPYYWAGFIVIGGHSSF